MSDEEGLYCKGNCLATTEIVGIYIVYLHS